MLKNTQKLPLSLSNPPQLAWGWVHTFVLVQLVCQLLLLLPTFAPLRVPLRMIPFLSSIVLLVWLKGDSPKHPATTPALCVMLILVLSLFINPYTNSFLSGTAQGAMYLAIMGPLFWVKRLKLTTQGFEWLIYFLWGFQTLSCIFGVLQMYFPGQFQPALSLTITDHTAWGAESLYIKLADGSRVLRPMGLTDAPGGVTGSGLRAVVFSIGIIFRHKNVFLRLLCAGSAIIGFFCIYMSYVRSSVIITCICLISLGVVLARKGQFGRLTALIGGATWLVIGSFSWAIAIGGEETLGRISSLFEGRADAVYQQNRGIFLEDTFTNLLPQYPLGAGLGRWGVMNGYFGDSTNLQSPPLWVEIQWTGWLFDGGIPLMIAYVVALYLVCQTTWRIAMSHQLGNLELWGGLIFAYDIGNLAFTFGYPVFISQSGMEFWLLNTALFIAAYNHWKQRVKPNRRVDS